MPFVAGLRACRELTVDALHHVRSITHTHTPAHIHIHTLHTYVGYIHTCTHILITHTFLKLEILGFHGSEYDDVFYSEFWSRVDSSVDANVSEKHNVPIFSPEDDDSMLLRNVLPSSLKMETVCFSETLAH
jgi:hypothetical protein